MKGWKTWTGAVIVAVAAFAAALGDPEIVRYANALMAAGAALGLVGVAHKIEKQK